MSTVLERITQDLDKTRDIHRLIQKENLRSIIRALQAWQTKRLLSSHEDLWQSKRFKPAMQFFIDEIYGPKDFSQRDLELSKAAPKIAKVLPDKGLEALENALRLNSLSLELDVAMVEALGNEKLSRDSYFACYRQCNNQAAREEQIHLVESLGLGLAQVVKIRGVSTILMLARRPAKLAGLSSLHEVIENGFKSFKNIGEVHDFIDPIITREKALMHSLFTAKSTKNNPLPELD
ncbi:FFLEELY motif protein [Ningiella sp. W23]|uniref:FFLEELY motif protein n=1 Tax=Ningiella sp. W23 TaxID=3023715 RepID=UPI003757653F